MSEELSFNYADYAKPVANKGAIKRNRILLISAYLLFSIVYFVLFIAIHLPYLIAILPVFLWMFVFFTWRYVSYDCEVRIEGGEVIFSKVYGKKRKEITRMRIKNLHGGAPYADPYLSDLEKQAPYTLLDLRADTASEQVYYILEKKDDAVTVILFELTQQVAHVLHYYNKSITVDKTYLKL